MYDAMPERGMKMISQSQLQEMRSVDITQVDRSTLVDIRNIHIDAALPAVHKTLKQSLCDYFLSLK